MIETANVQHLEMRIANWRYNRHVVVRDDNKIEIEIARSHCAHCITCQGRIDHVNRALGKRKYERRFAGGGVYYILSMPKKVARDPQAIAEFLGKKLQLTITPAN